VCHAAIVSAGYSPALGFIHTGKMLSFVYDVADLYKMQLTVGLAFRVVAEGTADLEGRVRRACRDAFHQSRLLQRIVPDIEDALAVGEEKQVGGDVDFDASDGLPGWLWDPDAGDVAGGVNQADVFDGGG
jgi:CRISPR-associated protein Cas1